ncbi:Phosphonates transport system permease protein phnE [Roseomonas mucosa]|uniref:Phosphonates transport system permease protein phnE n=1 Tax=Roseomonas mucosa TaxID=207340 RepID=A0A4Y1MUG3_9PROT|nr:phosphonate ABC transporter, permease protein PhnE [Roseomonas mucosa]AWV21084.1 Phosphonates transport system permease protein phnE [Roseomonas mucosa]MDT8276462.1 phosphonate ABC transporter, permease protein PhnE [Roseomonas mucosa]MDT8352743.1 phosphonate ABC transporter, permease protein PhnE [Roseomonas mucosa]MDU7523493.1 phosphonate ABC transporter, permease protein PhnE [Roseomonas mucosa]
MSIALPRLPEPRLAGLMGDYAQSRRAGRRQLLLALLVVAALAFVSAWVAEVDPGQLGRHIGAFFGYFDRITTLEGSTTGARVWTSPGEWFWGLRKWGLLLFDTMLMAYVGTLLGALAGFALCFVSSANLVRQPWLRGTARRLLEFCRTVPDIVFALIFVIAFGLGALPGVLAIAIHTAGALGKMCTEVVENIDMRPVEGIRSTGGGWLTAVRFGALPQVLPNFASYALLRFEINVRQAAVLGFVGAGGIGQDLLEAIRKFYYNDVSAILLLIILAVMVIDMLTERLRHHLIGLEQKV